MSDPLDDAAALHAAAVERLSAGDPAGGLALADQALALLRAHGDLAQADSPDAVNVLIAVAAGLRSTDRLVDAEAAGREAVGLTDGWPSDGDVLDRLRVQARRGLGVTLRAAGRYAEARPLLEEALADAEARLGPDDADAGACCNELGVLGKYTGAFDEAERHYERALAIAVAETGPDSLDAATVWHNIGGLHHSAGRPERALPAARRALELRRTALGPDHPATLADGAALAAVLLDLGRVDEGEELLQASLRAFEDRDGRQSYEVAVALHGLGVVAHARGDAAGASARFTEALTIKERLLGPDHADLAVTLVGLGVALHDTDRREEAVRAWRRALAVLGDTGEQHPARRAAQANLAAVGTA